jgi:hypothetical protein
MKSIPILALAILVCLLPAIRAEELRVEMAGTYPFPFLANTTNDSRLPFLRVHGVEANEDFRILWSRDGGSTWGELVNGLAHGTVDWPLNGFPSIRTNLFFWPHWDGFEGIGLSIPTGIVIIPNPNLTLGIHRIPPLSTWPRRYTFTNSPVLFRALVYRPKQALPPNTNWGGIILRPD